MNTDIKDVPLIKVATINKRIFEQIPRMTGENHTKIPAGEVLGFTPITNDVLIQREEGGLIRVHAMAYAQIKSANGDPLELAKIYKSLDKLRQIFLS